MMCDLLYQVAIEVVELEVLESLEHRGPDLAGRMVIVPGRMQKNKQRHIYQRCR